MINIILASHGFFAAGLREAAEMIMGDQKDLEVFGLYPGDTLESFSQKVEKAVEEFNDPENTLILTDLMGATPSNTALLMSLKHKTYALSGMNLPVLIELLSIRDEMGIEDVIKEISAVGKKGIISSIELQEGQV